MNQVINPKTLDESHNKYVAINKYRYIPMPDIEDDKWFYKTFTGASIVEFKDTGILYILPAGYSQPVHNGKVNRQDVYNYVFRQGHFTHPDSKLTMTRENNNPHDAKAIKFNYFDGVAILNSHLGYVPSPLNNIIHPMIPTDVNVDLVYMIDDLNGKYKAPIFRWVYKPNEINLVQPITNRFTALLYEDD